MGFIVYIRAEDLNVNFWEVSPRLTFCRVEWRAAAYHGELSFMLCDDLEGWDGVGWGGGRFKREGIYVHVCIHN